jgi:K+-sensing histidine kinase KdpD
VTRKKKRMDERILVCVYYGPNGERLIRRGCLIANIYDCPLYILTIDPQPFDEMDAEKSDYIARWRRLAEENDADGFIIRDNETRPVHKVIAEVARQKGITQIVIGQTVQSRWEQISKGSIVNSLLREIPFIDLHIVSVARHIKDPDSNYNKGIRAYLEREGEDYRLVFNCTKNAVYEGIFFKERCTDFNNGIFKFVKDDKMRQVEVIDDLVKDLTDVEFETNDN